MRLRELPLLADPTADDARLYAVHWTSSNGEWQMRLVYAQDARTAAEYILGSMDPLMRDSIDVRECGPVEVFQLQIGIGT